VWFAGSKVYLYGLPEAHLVRKDAPRTPAAQAPQPAHTIALEGTRNQNSNKGHRVSKKRREDIDSYSRTESESRGCNNSTA